jgi:hypothetical protein
MTPDGWANATGGQLMLAADATKGGNARVIGRAVVIPPPPWCGPWKELGGWLISGM